MLTIRNRIEEIKGIIPELETIGDYGKTKTISHTSWENRMKTIETKNLNKYKRSLTFSSLETYFNPCVLYHDSSYGTITFNEVKYKLIRQYMMSEEFNNQ